MIISNKEEVRDIIVRAEGLRPVLTAEGLWEIEKLKKLYDKKD